MHLRLAALAVVIASTACTPPPPETECVRNSDCARGRVCLDGLCVDGATGGGNASAGGTANGGGQSAAGGLASAGGASGGAVAGGSAGGAQTAGGSAGGVSAGGSAGGQDAGQQDGGVDGGSAGGAPDAGCQCTDLEECVGGLVCVPRYALLQWRAPVNGTIFTSGASVPLEASLILSNGRTRNDPGSLPFEASGDGGRLTGVLQRVDAGLFATSMSFPVGTWAATVALPDSGLVDGPLTFSVITTDFSVSWAPPPVRVESPGLQPHDPSQDAGTFFRRDETTTLVVTNAAAATNVTVTVFGLSGDGGTPSLALAAAPSCASCIGSGFCACYPLDLSRPVLEAFRGRFTFSVSGTVNGTTVTNTSQSHPTRLPTLPVTRWKWAWVLGAQGDGGVAATTNPALDRRGSLYFGFTEITSGTPSSGLKVLSHQGVVQLATQTAVVPTTDVVISSTDSGIETAMVGAQGAGFVTLGGDGGVTVLCDPSGGQGYLVSGPIGLVQVPMAFPGLLPIELPFGIATQPFTMPRRLVVASPFSPCTYVQLTPASASSKSPFFATAQNITFASSESSTVRLANTNGVSVTLAGAVALPSPLGPLADLFPTQHFSSAQVAMGTAAGGAWWTGMSTATALSGSAAGSGAVANGNSSNVIWYPTVDSGGLKLQSVEASDAVGLTPGTSIPIAPSGTASVALGQGGVVLVASDNGALTVVQNGRIVWATPSDARLGGRFSSRLMLDCSRDGANAPIPGRPGVAYLLGAPQQVQAIITDSRGLDVSQPWPMNGHDPRGTYNSSTPLAPFACP
ncbi:MAG: hypothetical protein GQE15_02865 [Archangiaceae bacterium]|nr:hypothetical protein [Archangiaceae bacterium]